jgi:hypothetical protein
MTLDQFAERIEFDYDEIRKDRTGNQWYRIRLVYQGRLFATEYFQGAELEEDGMKPTVVRVLHALQLESRWGRMTFIEYCDDAEISIQSAAAKATWIRAVTIHNQLCDFFGDDFPIFYEAEEEMA